MKEEPKRVWDLPISFTDGTADTVLHMPTPDLPVWLQNAGKNYGRVGLNLYAPTTKVFPPLMGKVRRLVKETPAELSEASSSPQHTPKK